MEIGDRRYHPSLTDLKRLKRRDVLRQTLRLCLVALAVLIGVLLVLLSPLALRAFEDFGSLDWARLSNIGSTYQAVGSWLAMLSLVGVAYSLVIQARRSRTDRLQHDRARHREIMRMAMDDPLYMDVWGNMTRVYPDDFDARRQYHYINMVWNYWRTSYQLGEIDPRRAHVAAIELFEGRPGRDWWERARGFWMFFEQRGKLRELVQIMDEEYQRAVDDGPPVEPSGTLDPSPAPKAGIRLRVIKVVVAAAIAGLVVEAIGRRVAKSAAETCPRPGRGSPFGGRTSSSSTSSPGSAARKN
ncbi:hypothetical protein GCM10009839_38770 [Catenulispora yoronensis]|uniref:DUF4760 domain-containing protein n=1 Tax=Catenulispora yoronensis TaxID=450799 RepID=A0ABP5FUN2_9ACTN